MDANSFIQRWRDKERALGFDVDPTDMIECADVTLPQSTAPCLSFDEAVSRREVWELYGPPTAWSPANRERLQACRVIGSDGAGNPICVEEASGTVWLLDHDDGFRTRQFINTSVGQLAECLLAYLGEQDAERFRSTVNAVDPIAMTEGSFWWHEAAALAESGAS